MSDLDERIAALAATARAWRDPEHSARAEAARRTLAHHDLYTAEALAFAVNQAMHAAAEVSLRRWVGRYEATESARVAVWAGDPEPLAGWRDVLAVALSGHRAVVRQPETSPFFLPAFFEEVRQHDPSLDVRFEDWETPPEGSDIVLGSGTDEAMDRLEARCDAAGVGAARRRLRGEGLTVAVADGKELADERIGLAEDALLYAEARRRVRVLWAPEGTSPDPLLDAFSGFRELFPAPPPLDGRLQMPRAFLEAAGTSHAWGPGFLVSRGAPEPQPAGHLRWSEYRGLDEVRTWLGEARVGLVVAAPRVAKRLGWDGPTVVPGDAHRPRLEGTDPFDLLGLG